jgi:hypothetical protein
MIAWGFAPIRDEMARASPIGGESGSPGGRIQPSMTHSGMPMQRSDRPRTRGALRRLVLGGLFAVGTVLALAPRADGVFAADAPAAAAVVAQAPGPGDAAQARPAPDGGAAASPPTAKARPQGTTPGDDEQDDEASGSERSHVVIGSHGIVVEKGGKRLLVEGLGHDRDYDSFEQFVRDAPWLAGLVFFTVLLVFLIPLLIIVLLIWYKIRKNRMANETMLKLAERGIVAPAAAIDAVATGTAAQVADAATAAPSAMPAYEHARATQRRTAWSDLRKGVILSAVGLGLLMWSMFEDGTPNGLGVVFLFVGIGYCVLWYFEDGTRTARRDPPVNPPAGGAR